MEQAEEFGVGDGMEDINAEDLIVETSPTERFIRFNELIGSGAYKLVYRGYDNETGREIAWVVIELSRLTQQEKAHVVEEISILKSLRHPNIIGFITQWADRKRNEAVFITELMSGGSLKHHLRRIRRPRLKLVKGWFRAILEGLNYLHTLPRPIIHRDIKCDNIFISSNNQIKIGDLGLAGFGTTAPATGTPNFMPPEAFKSRISPAVDIYAFAMCMIEIVTLETPYDQCSCIEEVIRRVEEGIRPQVINRIENEALRNLIEKCLSYDPKDRPTAQQLLLHPFLATDLPDEDLPVNLLPKFQAETNECSISSKHSEHTPTLLSKREGFTAMYQQFLKKCSEPESLEELKLFQQEEAKLLLELQSEQRRKHGEQIKKASKSGNQQVHGPILSPESMKRELQQILDYLALNDYKVDIDLPNHLKLLQRCLKILLPDHIVEEDGQPSGKLSLLVRSARRQLNLQSDTLVDQQFWQLVASTLKTKLDCFK